MTDPREFLDFFFFKFFFRKGPSFPVPSTAEGQSDPPLDGAVEIRDGTLEIKDGDAENQGLGCCKSGMGTLLSPLGLVFPLQGLYLLLRQIFGSEP